MPSVLENKGNKRHSTAAAAGRMIIPIIGFVLRTALPSAATKWPVRRLLPAIFVLLLFTISTPAFARDLPDTSPDGWWWYYRQTPAQVTSLLTANNARLMSIQVEQASPLLLTVAMVQNTGAYAKTWWWSYGQTAADLGNRVQQLNARIVNLDAYQVNGETFFAAVFISNTGADAASWWWYYGQRPANISALLQTNKARLVDLRQYSANGATVYAAVMVDNTGPNAMQWWWYYNVGAAEVASLVQQNGAYLETLQVANASNPTFNVIMNKLPTPGAVGWWWYYGVSAAQLTNLYISDAAWLRDVKTYEGNGQRVFTALMLGTKPRAPIVIAKDSVMTMSPTAMAVYPGAGRVYVGGLSSWASGMNLAVFPWDRMATLSAARLSIRRRRAPSLRTHPPTSRTSSSMRRLVGSMPPGRTGKQTRAPATCSQSMNLTPAGTSPAAHLCIAARLELRGVCPARV